MDLIERQAAIDAIIGQPPEPHYPSWYAEQIKDLPSAQPEQKKGRWIVIEKGCKLTSYKCSECGRYIADDTGYDVKKDYPFCHCGADMREDTE